MSDTFTDDVFDRFKERILDAAGRRETYEELCEALADTVADEASEIPIEDRATAVVDGTAEDAFDPETCSYDLLQRVFDQARDTKRRLTTKGAWDPDGAEEVRVQGLVDACDMADRDRTWVLFSGPFLLRESSPLGSEEREKLRQHLRLKRLPENLTTLVVSTEVPEVAQGMDGKEVLYEQLRDAVVEIVRKKSTRADRNIGTLVRMEEEVSRDFGSADRPGFQSSLLDIVEETQRHIKDACELKARAFVAGWEENGTQRTKGRKYTRLRIVVDVLKLLGAAVRLGASLGADVSAYVTALRAFVDLLKTIRRAMMDAEDALEGASEALEDLVGAWLKITTAEDDRWWKKARTLVRAARAPGKLEDVQHALTVHSEKVGGLQVMAQDARKQMQILMVEARERAATMSEGSPTRDKLVAAEAQLHRLITDIIPIMERIAQHFAFREHATAEVTRVQELPNPAQQLIETLEFAKKLNALRKRVEQRTDELRENIQLLESLVSGLAA